jgi:hypothetical protein
MNRMQAWAAAIISAALTFGVLTLVLGQRPLRHGHYERGHHCHDQHAEKESEMKSNDESINR